MEKKARILIVDDEPVVRQTLGAFLALDGYELFFTEDGRQALARLDDIKPDVILLDIMMPGPSGIEVCQRLKSDARWRHVPIILVTALGTSQDLTRGLDAGADDFLRKPVDGPELEARVRSMLRIKAQYDELEEQRQALETALRQNEEFSTALAQHLEVLEVLHDVGLRLMYHLDSDSVLGLVSRASFEIIPEATRCVMHLVSSDAHEFLPVVFSADAPSKIVYPLVGFEPIVAEVLASGQISYVADVQSDRRYTPTQLPDIRSLLVVPLIHEQEPIGTLSVGSSRAGAFEENHRHVLSILANQASVAIIKARYFEERVRSKEREKEALRNLFQRYVSPAVVERLIDGSADLALGGKRQEISVMFADLRGFTGFSENEAPERLIEVLNQYLALAVQAILAQDGTLDKFMGDAVMAFFNAPLPQPDHVMRAIRAALAMRQAITDYNGRQADHLPLGFGIGIHVGQVVIGNVGTAHQMNYTAIGDPVNLAKRLEEWSGAGEIILSQAAYEAAQAEIVVEDLGWVRVRGRSTPEHIYALLGLKDGPA